MNLTELLDSGMVALNGYFTVFLGLILLMLVVLIMGKAFSARLKRTAPPQETPAPAIEEIPDLAPGSAGALKLHNVDPKTAAMIMAIVADKTGKPLNELRFLSIKEVK